MIIASVDLRLVVENREQLDRELNLIQKRNRTHIIGWVENYYEGKRKPRGKKQLEAIEVVEAKLKEGG